MTQEEINQIIKLLEEALQESGQSLTMATLHVGDTAEILVDNRKDGDIN